jgi:methylated-DNA-protein-cysteine methyltransferase-like protein
MINKIKSIFKRLFLNINPVYNKFMEERKLYDIIFDTVRQIPAGKVASYGQIAGLVGRCSAQMIGFALASLAGSPNGTDVPWQRVINGQGKISPHGFGLGSGRQRALLEEEGVVFGLDNSIDFDQFGWLGNPNSRREPQRRRS